MGNAPLGLHVLDNKKDPTYGIGFSKAMFTAHEWESLKKFCIENNIPQTDMNRVFNKFLNNEEAHLRKMRIYLPDVKKHFMQASHINQEIADVFLPQLFYRDMPELDPPRTGDEVSFARFIIIGCILCLQPIQDTIFDFFSINKRNYHLRLNATIYSYNLQKAVTLLNEERQRSATLQYIINKINTKNDTEVTIKDTMILGIKYPLLFYQLHIFVSKFKRVFFGEKFWRNRPQLPSRFFDLDDRAAFTSESRTLLLTAQAIVQDHAAYIPEGLTTTLPQENFELLTPCCVHLKHAVGYQMARSIISTSQYSVPASEIFAHLPQDYDVEERIYDPKLHCEFIYNAGTGFRSWVESYRDGSGTLLRERCNKTDAKHLEKVDVSMIMSARSRTESTFSSSTKRTEVGTKTGSRAS